ncbi:ATP-dependent DNA helicase RecG [Jatrophihabitans sp.]|uniref:ATP-dependent DNA helicase RecG n=1 Tax=Jatrophihabitans sp. TaxID=1932789 RepID=UPI0030C687DB|nr:ATP-dependent helicase RecG [Jatrophihabitans sp.]
MSTITTPLVDLVGDRTAKALAKAFEMRTADDLLRHYPRRLAQRGELTDLASLEVDDDVTVVAEVVSRTEKGYGKSVRAEVVISDGRGRLQLVFFGQRSLHRTRNLTPGTQGLFAGKVGLFNRTRQLAHPDYVLLSGELDVDAYAGALIPVYPATKDLPTWTIANAVAQVLRMLDPIPDPVPADIRARHRLSGFDAAIRSMHAPASTEEWFRAKHRLVWDEAFGLQLVLAQRRATAAANPAVARPPKPDGLRAAFEAQLPFTLTAGQREVGEVIAGELSRPHPMQRLLQGEVGSGKTVVALRAMLQVVDAGGQAALLAPTEVLAAQHARTIDAMLGPLAHAGQLGGAEQATRVALLTGSLSAGAKKAALLEAAGGAAGIVVGTHALIQEHVQFAELGLVVVDEQHRFGVEQRDALRSKATSPPHLLVMTATPIPRTVAMTVFGDLETSTLSELPAGRAPILTSVVPAAEKPAWVERVWQRIREEVAAGHQAYIVCPRIGAGAAEEDEPSGDDARRPPLAVLDVLPMLAEGPLHGLRIAALHGRLTPDEKDRTMTDFTAGRVDVLVATTVIEVGVDVPNATVMAVLDADRFGVSQLHQLRGRIGRGNNQGVCLLVTEAPEAAPARERLAAVSATTDGFALARLDVEQRREGDILGAAQSGRRSQLKLLSLLRDEATIDAARAEATALVADDPALERQPLLAAQVATLLAADNADYLEKS